MSQAGEDGRKREKGLVCKASGGREVLRWPGGVEGKPGVWDGAHVVWTLLLGQCKVSEGF